MDCQIVDPLAERSWNNWLADFEDATVFHTSEWARILVDSYGYTPLYTVARDSGRIVGLLPMMEVRSIWTGRRGGCLPFSDECAPLLASGMDMDVLISPMKELGRERDWDFIELRGGGDSVGRAIETARFLSHEVVVEQNEEEQFRKLADSHRRNVRKSLRSGIEAHRLQTRDGMDAYYALHCMTRQRHGLPPQPIRFFRAISESLIARKQGFVMLARFEDQWISGAVYLQYGTKAVYKFGASNLEFQHLRPANLVMWEALSYLREQGTRVLSLGRTDTQDVGLARFKRGWGASASSRLYHRIGLGKDVAKTDPAETQSISMATRLMQKTPIPILRMLGEAAYRHMG